MKRITIFLSFFTILFAQHNHNGVVRCAADELEKELQLNNPEFIAERDLYIQRGKKLLNENPQWRTNPSSQNTVYVPVIFHVLYSNASENLNKDQVGYNFDQVNLDFQGTNPDRQKVPSAPNPNDAPYDPGIDYSFQNVSTSHQIEFVGSQGERNGSDLVEGLTILRYNLSGTGFIVEGVGDAMTAANNINPDNSLWSGQSGGHRDGYMNIYISPLGGNLLGQAYLGYPAAVVLTGTVGSVENNGTYPNYNRGRTLTHELGHNFTYQHTFGAYNCTTQYYSDIPPQNSENYSAFIYEWPNGSGNFYGRGATNGCISTSGKGDQFMNFMDYVSDSEMIMFSEQQALDGYSWALGRDCDHDTNPNCWVDVVDGVSTVLTSNSPLATSNDGFTVDVTFAEAVTGFTEDDLVVTNGVVTNFNGGNGTSFSFDIDAIVDGEVKVSIPEGSVVGSSSGHDNFSSNEVVIVVDRENPIVGTLNIANLEASQYITRDPNIQLELNNFYDATSGIVLYLISVGLSPEGEEILPLTAYSGGQGGVIPINVNALGLTDYQQYYITVSARDLAGLESDKLSQSFFYFGSLLGDYDDDWDVDFDDYSAFISEWPYVDIAPVTGSAPYYFPNFDGVADGEDLTMFEMMWDWSLQENGLQVPNYTISGSDPFLRIINNQLIIKFPDETRSGQIYFDYDPNNYNVSLVSGVVTGRLILNNTNNGITHVEFGDYGDSNSVLPPPELRFSFQSLTDSYDFLRVSYSATDGNNQSLSEGYDLLQTAPSAYRLSQSYPNPFNSFTTIEFDMPATEKIKMVILDIRGRVVRTLIDNEERFGYQAIQWDGKNNDGEDSSSGVYFYQIRSSNFNAVGKLLYLK